MPAAAALRGAAAAPLQDNRRVDRLFLPPGYPHRWEEFPPDAPGPLWVWCETDEIWDAVRARRPRAQRWAGHAGPTFPPAPLRVDAETGRFSWTLRDGAALRAWGGAR